MPFDPSQGNRVTKKDRRGKVFSGCWRSVARLGRRSKMQIGTAAINLALYAIPVVAYFFAVLQWLNEPLGRLFRQDLADYALVSVILILGQGLLLDIVTSNLLRLARRMNRKARK
ncbi:MAG: hypothetical protein JSV36_00745 [Anaerolineae bacterium]|nr:MAG: hypothetical protein JSV36_00745 [Anaerolineae bacterium]